MVDIVKVPALSGELDIARHVLGLFGEELDVLSHQVLAAVSIGDDAAVTNADRLEMMLCLEDDFGIEFTDRELNEVRTVGDVIALIASKVGAPLDDTKALRA